MRSIFLAVLLLATWQLSAQTMVIHFAGQPDVRISLDDIAKITFDLSSTSAISTPMRADKLKMVMASILPNPFSTKINYSLTKNAPVTIRVMDMQGRVVRTILNSKMGAGQYSATWNSCNDAGAKVSNAPYIVNVLIDGQSISKTLFLVN